MLLLLASAVLLYLLPPAEPLSGEALFAQHFTPYSLNQSIRSNAATDSLLTQAYQQYQNQAYTDAAQTFERLRESQPDNVLFSFCLAHAYLNQQAPKLDLAQSQFQKVIDQQQSIYVPRAKWYLALLFLKKEEKANARPLLEDLAKSTDQYGSRAQALLQQLN
ncbi:MAG: hypothetical protein AAGD05_07085 [Bacteroidota bacterium]